MCDCRKDTEARLLAHVQKDLPEGARHVSVKLAGYVMIFGGPVPVRNYMVANIEYVAPTKGTSKKPSVMRTRKATISMVGNYCMFCGEKYEKDAEVAIDHDKADGPLVEVQS